MTDIRKILDLIDEMTISPEIGDKIDLEFGDTLIESVIEEITDDKIIITVDDIAINLMLEESQLKKKAINENLSEAEYRGRKVPLGKRMKGDVKKFKVYVKGPKGNVVKVNFGDPNMRIKKSNPKRRKSFRARHNCANPGPRWKARYWSCRAW